MNDSNDPSGTPRNCVVADAVLHSDLKTATQAWAAWSFLAIQDKWTTEGKRSALIRDAFAARLIELRMEELAKETAP